MQIGVVREGLVEEMQVVDAGSCLVVSAPSVRDPRSAAPSGCGTSWPLMILTIGKIAAADATFPRVAQAAGYRTLPSWTRSFSAG